MPRGPIILERHFRTTRDEEEIIRLENNPRDSIISVLVEHENRYWVYQKPNATRRDLRRLTAKTILENSILGQDGRSRESDASRIWPPLRTDWSFVTPGNFIDEPDLGKHPFPIIERAWDALTGRIRMGRVSFAIYLEVTAYQTLKLNKPWPHPAFLPYRGCYTNNQGLVQGICFDDPYSGGADHLLTLLQRLQRTDRPPLDIESFFTGLWRGLRHLHWIKFALNYIDSSSIRVAEDDTPIIYDMPSCERIGLNFPDTDVQSLIEKGTSSVDNDIWCWFLLKEWCNDWYRDVENRSKLSLWIWWYHYYRGRRREQVLFTEIGTGPVPETLVIRDVSDEAVLARQLAARAV